MEEREATLNGKMAGRCMLPERGQAIGTQLFASSSTARYQEKRKGREKATRPPSEPRIGHPVESSIDMEDIQRDATRGHGKRKKGKKIVHRLTSAEAPSHQGAAGTPMAQADRRRYHRGPAN